MKVIVINGMARSGKDTFADMCCELGNGIQFSSVEKVKQAALLLGWSIENRSEKARYALSKIAEIADYAFSHRKQFIRNTVCQLEKEGYDFVFVHIREPELIQWAVDELDASTVLIRNTRVPVICSNESDRNVENFHYDAVIENEGSLKELSQKAALYLKNVIEVKS